MADEKKAVTFDELMEKIKRTRFELAEPVTFAELMKRKPTRKKADDLGDQGDDLGRAEGKGNHGEK